MIESPASRKVTVWGVSFLAIWLVFTTGITIQQILWLTWAKQTARPVSDIIGSASFTSASITVAIFGAALLAHLRPLRPPHRLLNASSYLAYAAVMVVGLAWAEWFSLVKWFHAAPDFPIEGLLYGTFARDTVELLTVSILVHAFRSSRELRDGDLQRARCHAEREIQNARVRERAARANLKALRDELKPHFLFNALHSISAQALSTPTAACHSLDLLKELMLPSDHALDARITLNEELQGLEPYVALARVRFGDRLRFRTAVEAEALEAMVPPFILQPLVENALKYAVATSHSGAEITVVATRQQDELRVQVSDNGPGPLHTGNVAGMGIGLANLRARLQLAFGATASVSLDSGTDAGASATLRIPWTAPTAQERAIAAVQADGGSDHHINEPTVLVVQEAPHVPTALTIWMGAITAAGIWSFFEALGGWLAGKFYEDPVTWLGSLYTASLDCFAWLPVGAAVFAIVRRDRPDTRWLTTRRIAQALLAVGLALWWLAVAWATSNLVVTERPPFTFKVVVIAAFGRTLIYVVTLFAIAHWIQATKRFRKSALLEIRLQTQVQAEQARLTAEALQQRSRSLRVEMSWRFIEPTIAAVREMIMRDAATARRMIVRLADALRAALRRSEDDMLPVSTAFLALQPIMELERFRFGEQLMIELLVEPGAEALRIPDVILQPLIVSAVQYLTPSGGHIRLSAHAESEAVLLRLHVSGSHPNKRMSDVVPDEIIECLHQVYGHQSILVHTRDTREGGEITLHIPSVPARVDPLQVATTI